MSPLPSIVDIVLQPGEIYFGGGRTRVRTLLGSCVAISLWHPQRRIGGLCHYVLPCRAEGRAEADFDSRYAEDALQLFIHEMRGCRTRPAEYEAKLFGGGNMFPDQCPSNPLRVPDRNVDAGRSLLARHGLRVVAEHLGGAGHRQVVFELWSGHVWVKYDEGVQTRCSGTCR